jgi:hypothetical protein|nr:MAG TPA: Fe-S oxidoreductase [Caudoviricetes sp.]
MKKISLSIIPTYWCKTNCKYCYLGDLRKDQTTLDLQCLDNKLHQLVENDYVIDSISVYGGEISLLDEQYLIQIVKIIRSHVSNQVTIGFCTSGYNRSIFELAEYLKVRVTIPLNQERPDYKKNLQLIKQHNCSLGVVVLPSIINTPVDQLVEFYDSLGRDVFFYQFYPSSINRSPYSFDIKQYTDFVISFINEYKKKPRSFGLINLSEWMDKCYNPEASGFIYISPNGKWMTTGYSDCLESFVEFDTLDQWKQYCKKERLQRLIKCNACPYYDKCKAEHLVVMGEEYCSGMRKLITSGCLG